ncbi:MULTISPECIES: HDOD domain-containing protein [Marinobacter]|uniref:HD-like signal output (HDOD) domain, no enzymatic activity n=1 Tax=Marinobacter segnicrescens TaxID=430453 RepID=A0A1I0CDQ3_9GAMM|nr:MULTISPECIES: HDOD domain-containing protein [Marinobacter]UZD64943.1 HDOD domain-containing protein [Marinobacter sp. AN1]SET17690.1 HD-like signal output (HDOD) domain, no enzymatic activity [Marinobacter segnicrescens]
MPGLFSWIRARLFQGHGATDYRADSNARVSSAKLPQGDPHADQSREPRDRLDDHLFCWLLDCSPRQLGTPSPFTGKILREIENRLDQNRLEELPRQPLTLPILMRTLGSESTTRKDVSGIILSDAALTDQVLQVANSPFFKAGDQIVETVDQAVFLLGLDGIRNVVSASVMRPMLAARNSTESTFTQRVWRWGLSCARAAELIALNRKEESTSYFMAGLLPALSYLTLRREVQSIIRRRYPDQQATPQMYYEAIDRFAWATAQKVARAWNLPPRYHALLLAAERPVPGEGDAPLTEGITLGTREVLRDAHQRNLADEELQALMSLEPRQLEKVRQMLSRFLAEGLSSR